jgi:hypothetical protein
VRPWPEFHPRELLERLTSKGIDFVIVGGYAAVLHGSQRLTQDLDLCYATDAANLSVLGEALVELEARLFGVAGEVPFVADGRTLVRTELLTLHTSLGKLDLMTHPAGAPEYRRLRDGADRFELGGFLVRVASVADLKRMKRAAGRPKDLADLAELEAIEQLAAD